MKKEIKEILLRRKNNIIVDYDSCVETDNMRYVATIIKNINDLGFTFSNELTDRLKVVSLENIKEFYTELVPMLKALVGANVEYKPFYRNFPEEVMSMSDTELYMNAIIAYATDCEILIREEEKERLPLFESTELKVIGLGSEEDILTIRDNLIGAKTSLSEQDKTDLITLLNEYWFDDYDNLPQITFKENLPIISKLIIDNTSNIVWFDVLKHFYKTATDVLRLVVYLSDGDVSLSEPTKFKSMPRAKRKLIIQLLNNCGNIEEDMLRNRMTWIRLGEFLHVSETRYLPYSKVQVAFNKLRNNGKIQTFGGRVDKAIAENRIDDALKLLAKRPGELARCLDYLLREFYDCSDQIIKTFEDVASQISVPVLLQVKEHFDWRTTKNDTRVFFPKGQLTKAYTVANELKPIDCGYCAKIVYICSDAIVEQFKSKEPMGNVYIAPEMKNYCVPQSQRSANSAMKIITRGSRFKLKDDAKFIRFGIHWMNEIDQGYEQRTDIDLSCSFLNDNFGRIDHVSYTSLCTSYSAHSGDLTNAPRKTGGASEFIDVDIKKAINAGIRYAVVQVYGYTSTYFYNLDEMLFNWQEGVEPVESNIFDPRRVQQNINLGGNTDCEIPMVIDLKNREIIWCDIALTTRTDFPRCVENNVKGLSATVMGIIQAHKPSLYSLATLNAMARGRIVNNRNDADVIFDTDLTKPTEIITKVIEVQNEQGEVLETRTETEEKVKDCRIISPWDMDYWVGEML